MYDRVVTINNTHWLAHRKPGATLVDLRMLDPNDRSSEARLVFRPEKLRELGIPDALIEAAGKSDPQGFLLFDDLPVQTQKATGLANEPQQRESGGGSCPRRVQLAEVETGDALQRAKSDVLHLQSQSDRRGSIAGTGQASAR